MTTTCFIDHAVPTDGQHPRVTFDVWPADEYVDVHGDTEPVATIGFSVLYSGVTFRGRPDEIADYFASIATDLRAFADTVGAGRDPEAVVLVDGHEYYRHGID